MINIQFIVIILLIILCLRAISQQYRAIQNFKKYSNDKFQINNFNKKLYILLPAHEEADIVEDTLQYFTELTKKFKNVIIVTITNNRSESQLNKVDLTADKIRKWKSVNNPKILSIEDSSELSSKSSKLNYFLKWFKKNHPTYDMRNSYIAVYDFDSRPSITTFEEVLNLIEIEYTPEILQQISFPLGQGINKLNFFTKLMAFGHCERILRVETLHHTTWEKKLGVFQDLRICIGASLFIQLATIIDVGGFPPDSDDIRLGYRLDLKKHPRITLQSPNFVQPTPSIKDTFLQAFRIFSGVFSTISEVANLQNCHDFLNGLYRAFMTHLRDIEGGVRILFLFWGILLTLQNKISVETFIIIFFMVGLVCLVSVVTVLCAKKIMKDNNCQPLFIPSIIWLACSTFFPIMRFIIFIVFCCIIWFPAYFKNIRNTKTKRI